jgi:hypothetical protein
MSSKNAIEHLRNISIATVSSIPVLGGPLSVLLDKYLPSYMERRRNALMTQLADDLVKLTERITPEKLASDEFIAVFLKVFRRAMEEHLQEKLEAFRAIILNAALAENSEFDEVSLFIRLVSDLTADQIRILRLLRNQEFRESKEGLFLAVQHVWHKVDADYLMACVTELLRYNLATSNPKNPEAQGNHTLTMLGIRFIEYITLPRSAD